MYSYCRMILEGRCPHSLYYFCTSSCHVVRLSLIGSPEPSIPPIFRSERRVRPPIVSSSFRVTGPTTSGVLYRPVLLITFSFLSFLFSPSLLYCFMDCVVHQFENKLKHFTDTQHRKPDPQTDSTTDVRRKLLVLKYEYFFVFPSETNCWS